QNASVQEDEKTYVGSYSNQDEDQGTELTMIPQTGYSQVSSVELEKQIQRPTQPSISPPPEEKISEQQTIMLTRPINKDQWNIADAIKDPRKLSGALQNSARDFKKQVVGLLVTLSVIFVVYNLIDMGGDPDPNANSAWTPIRATIPKFDSAQKDP